VLLSTKFIAIPHISSKNGKQWRNKTSTELYCLFVAADSIVDAISSSAVLFCDPKTSSAQIQPQSDLNS